MKENIKQPRRSTHLLSLILMLSVILGAFSASSFDAQARNLQQETQALHIAQGDFITYQIIAGEVFEFSLDVSSPVTGVSYNWTVEKAPDLGEAVLVGAGRAVSVNYLSHPSQGGQDTIVIGVTNSTGQHARTTIVVSVEPLPEYTLPRDMRSPAEDRWAAPGFESVEPAREDSLTRGDNPRIAVNPQDNWVSGSNWPAHAEVTLSVGAEVWIGTVSEWGWVDFDTWPFNFLPGQELVMTDGNTTRTHTIANLAVTTIDEANNILKGTADPDQSIGVSADNPNKEQWQWLNLTADESGKWEATFSNVDIEAGAYGWVYQYDSDDNYTWISWFVPDPIMRVNPKDNWVVGERWPAHAEVTLSVGAAQWTSTASGSGWVNFDTWPFNFRSGQELVMTAEKYARTHTVANLSVTIIDQENNTLTGTADPFQAVEVRAANYVIETTADEDGNWTANFSKYLDINQDAYGWVLQYDQAGNWTEINWRVPNPNIQANPLQNSVHGRDWTPDTGIRLSIGRYRWGRLSRDDGFVWFSTNPVNLGPGQLLEMTDGTYTRTHTVANLAVTTIDEVNNLLRGTADPGQEIEISANHRYKEQWQWLYPTADSSGNWEADFSGDVDIEPGAYGWVYQYDDDGNYTWVRWFVPDPYLRVSGRMGAWGQDWTPGAQVTLTIGTNQWTGTADATGYVWISTFPVEIQPGQVLTMSDGTDQVQYTMANLAIMEIDQEQDTVSGTADPNRKVEVRAQNKFGEMMQFEVTSDAAGNWTADFSVYEVDIGPGSSGSAGQYDEDRNGAWTSWVIPDPWIMVYPEVNHISGWSWSAGAEAVLTIDSRQWTSTVNDWGDVFFFTGDYDIQAGDILKLTDGFDYRTHTVANLSVDAIDETENTLSGTGDPNTGIWVSARDKDGRFADYYLTTEDDGAWFVDFYGRVDIGPGTRGSITYRDVPGSGTTHIDWYLPDPSIEVMIEHDFIRGMLWPANVAITVDVNGNQWETTSSDQGFFWISTKPDFDLLPGQTITVSGGGYTIIYEPWTIEITNVNYQTDVISGTAQPPTSIGMSVTVASPIEIEVTACDSGICATQYIEMAMAGNWEADFSGVIDLRPGTSNGSVRSRDGSAGSTVISWRTYATYLPFIKR